MNSQMDPCLHHVLSLIREMIEPYLIRDVASICRRNGTGTYTKNQAWGTGMTVCGKRYGTWTIIFRHGTETRHYDNPIPHAN
jgi:hypothetical protein